MLKILPSYIAHPSLRTALQGKLPYIFWKISTTESLSEAPVNSWGRKRRNWKCVRSCRATICLASQRHGGIAHATGVLQRTGTGSVGRPSQEGEARSCPLHENCRNVWSSATRWMTSQVRVYGSGLEGRPM